MRRRFLILALATLVFTACASEDARPRSSRLPTPQPTATFFNGGECPSEKSDRLHPKAGCVTTASGSQGTLSIYALVGGDARPRGWRIHLETGESVIDRVLEAGNQFNYPRAIAAIDVNSDGRDEWLIKNTDLASHGTNWQRLELFAVENDDLVPVMLEDEPLWVNVGGPSRLGEGARCDEGGFVLLRVEAENRINTVWSYSERFFEIEGHAAELIDRREGTLRLTDYNDPDLDPYYSVTCGSFVYP